MYFISQSASKSQKIILAGIIFVLLTALAYGKLTYEATPCVDESNEQIFFCELTYYTIEDDATKTCEQECREIISDLTTDVDSIVIDLDNTYCTQTDPTSKYDSSKSCYADFVMSNNYATLTPDEINDIAAELVLAGDIAQVQRGLFVSTFLAALQKFDLDLILIEKLNPDILSKLSQLTYPILGLSGGSIVVTETGQAGNDILTAVLNKYFEYIGSANPVFDNNFFCPSETSCDITGNAGSLNLKFGDLTLPLDQFKELIGVSVTTDLENSMLKLYSTADTASKITGMSCGSNSGISTILWANSAYFECDSTKATVTPGASMEYNRFTFENQCGSDKDCTNEIYFGNCADKEGICIERDKLSFNNVNGFIIKKGCLAFNINDKGSSSTDLCVKNSDFSDSAASCAESFEFQCSNGMTGFANNKCAQYDVDYDTATGYEACMEFGAQEVGTGPNIDCACSIAGTPLAGSACGQAAGLTAEEDITFQQLQDQYPNCKVCSSSAGMDQYMCERALASGEVADYEKIADMVKAGIEKCKSATSTTTTGTMPVTVGCTGVLGATVLTGCKSVAAAPEYCDSDPASVTGTSVTVTCSRDNGGTAFVSIDPEVGNECTSKRKKSQYTPGSVLASTTCDKKGKTTTATVTPGAQFFFGVYGGEKCEIIEKGETMYLGDQVSASPEGSCGTSKYPSCSDIAANCGNGKCDKYELKDCNDCNATANCIDEDKDSYFVYDKEKCGVEPAKVDCDDKNNDVHPGAKEICGNGIDEDCDKSDLCNICNSPYVDADKDGSCSDKDCNDIDASMKPGSIEIICGDGIDQNCNERDDDCAVCREGEQIRCIGNTTITAEDKTCTYYRSCNKESYFDDDCLKENAACNEHGACLKDQVLSCPRQLGVCAGSKQKCSNDLKWPGCDYSTIQNYNENEGPTAIGTCGDNIDNDCDGSIDEGCACYGAPDIKCGSIAGDCGNRIGKQECKNGFWGNCTNHNVPRPEKADIKDNDCDGSIDEWTNCGITYKESFSRSCGLNSCGEGLQYCSKDIDNALKFTECIGSIVAMLEICQDDVDNDCDGSINEGCGCMENDERECGSSMVGICEKGVQKCINGILGSCTGIVEPEEEECNGFDDDCDGSVDEGCPCIEPMTKKEFASRPCSLQLGVCKNINQSCINGQFGTCDYGVNYQKDKEAKCDDLLDNDCDGKIDDADSDCISTLNVKCSDGTLIGECSKTKPHYCVDGLLEERCSSCGCPSGKECPSGGKGNCQLASCGNNICDAGETKTSCAADCDKAITRVVDSDSDGLSDSEEETKGTNPYNKDTDFDTISDYDDEKPLCNEDGACEADREYPETIDNCPSDCTAAGVEKDCLIWLALALLITGLGLGYFVYRDNKSLLLEKKEIVKLEKANDLNAKNRKRLFDIKNKRFKNKLIIDILVLLLGLILLFVYIAKETPLFSCILNIVLSVLIILGFAGYLYYLYDLNKKKAAVKTEVTKPIVEIKREMEEHKNVEQLNQYVKTALERGIKEDKIKSLCLNSGWNKNEVENAINKARIRSGAEKFDALKNYIKKSLEKGIKEPDIKQKLIKSGWKKEIIDREFENLKR